MSTSWETPICALKVPSVHHLMVFPAGAWRKVWMQVQASHCYGTMCNKGRGLYGLPTEPEHKSVTECFRVGAQNTYWCFQPTTQTKYLSKASFERHRLTLRGRREPQCCDPPLLLDLARKQTRLWTTSWWLTEFILKRYTAGDPRGWITQVGSGTTCREVSLPPPPQHSQQPPRWSTRNCINGNLKFKLGYFIIKEVLKQIPPLEIGVRLEARPALLPTCWVLVSTQCALLLQGLRLFLASALSGERFRTDFKIRKVIQFLRLPLQFQCIFIFNLNVFSNLLLPSDFFRQFFYVSMF